MKRRRLTLLAGLGMAALFITVLVIRILPQIKLVGVGSRAPEFQAIDLGTGRPGHLSDYCGKVILLNIWATYCLPCRDEMPAIQRLYQALAGTDFRLVSVSIDFDDSTVVRKFAQELGLTFDILHDQPGGIQQIYQTRGVPESFVIDRQGVIVKKVIGPVEWDGPVSQLLIRRLLDEH